MPDAEHIALLRRLLADPDRARQEDAVTIAIEWAEATAIDTWDQAAGQPPRQRLLAALQAAAEAMEELGLQLEAGAKVKRGRRRS
jgi:hypothetical protein